MTTEEALKLIEQDMSDEDVDWDCPLGKAYKISFQSLKEKLAREKGEE